MPLVIYDASPDKGSGALFGFFGISAETREKMGQDKILKLVVDQLVKVFGNEARNVKAFFYKNWSDDSETAVEEDFSPFKDFQTYGKPPVEDVWEKNIIFAGTETSSEWSGHLEGALQSAEQAALEIIHLNKKS